MNPTFIHKFYGRLGSEPEQFLGLPEAPESMFLELSELQKEFGDKWDIWIEKFHRVHPHRQLQRRLDGLMKEAHVSIRLAKGEGQVKGWIDGHLEGA